MTTHPTATDPRADRAFTPTDYARLVEFATTVHGHNCWQAEATIDALIRGSKMIADERDQAREERDAALLENGKLRGTVRALSRHNARLRVQAARKPKWYETALAAVVTLRDELASLHPQVYGLLGFALLAGFVGAVVRGIV